MGQYPIFTLIESRPWRTLGLVLAGGLLLMAGAACQVGPAPEGAIPPADEVEMKGQELNTANQNPKLDSALNQLLAAYAQGGQEAVQDLAESRLLTLQDSRILVEIVTTEDTVDEVRGAIEAAGGEYRAHYAGRIEALVPIDQLASLAARPEVQLIRQPQEAIPASPM